MKELQKELDGIWQKAGIDAEEHNQIKKSLTSFLTQAKEDYYPNNKFKEFKFSGKRIVAAYLSLSCR